MTEKFLVAQRRSLALNDPLAEVIQLAQAPEAPRPAQATPAEKPTRDPTEVALSAIAEALDVKTGLGLEPAERRSLDERLERVSPPRRCVRSL